MITLNNLPISDNRTLSLSEKDGKFSVVIKRGEKVEDSGEFSTAEKVEKFLGKFL